MPWFSCSVVFRCFCPAQEGLVFSVLVFRSAWGGWCLVFWCFGPPGEAGVWCFGVLTRLQVWVFSVLQPVGPPENTAPGRK
jgi:hypothetical protein